LLRHKTTFFRGGSKKERFAFRISSSSDPSTENSSIQDRENNFFLHQQNSNSRAHYVFSETFLIHSTRSQKEKSFRDPDFIIDSQHT